MEITQAQCLPAMMTQEPHFDCDKPPETNALNVTKSYCCTGDFCNWEDDAMPTMTPRVTSKNKKPVGKGSVSSRGDPGSMPFELLMVVSFAIFSICVLAKF